MTFQVYLSNAENYCLSFRLPNQEEYWVGYRVTEGEPLIADSIQSAYVEHPVAKVSRTQLIHAEPLSSDDGFAMDRGWALSHKPTADSSASYLGFTSKSDGSAICTVVYGKRGLRLAWHLTPAEDGIWFELHVRSEGSVPGGYCLQQCLRFTGAWNDPWRVGVAHIPYLSELDMQAMGNANGTLTYAVRDGEVFPFPLAKTMVPTKGATFSNVPRDLVVDHGLVARQTADRALAPEWYWDRVAPDSTWETISSGMYWERTALISNRHPADCVHSWVDIGPMDQGEDRMIRGRFYYLEGSIEYLLTRFREEFAIAS